jgi:AAA+ ATPase superfamily predicted ATPase
MFVNRVAELAALEKALPRTVSRLFVLYGRRRVGKTELLKHFYESTRRPHVFYVGDLGTATEHVRALSSRLGAAAGDAFLEQSPLSDWRSLVAYLDARKAPLDLVLDEFPYLCEAEPALPSYLQNAWDGGWKERNIRLVLCGSSVGFMERNVLGERSPLFGRRTGQMRLEAMDFWSARAFFAGSDSVEQVQTYACLGGTPAYLEKLDRKRDLPTNLVDQVLSPFSYLHDEPRLMLAQELREPRNYFAILTSIAAGNTRLNEIVQDCGLERSLVSRYLDTLMDLEMVSREVPVTEADPSRSRRGLYRVEDPFLRFWFRFLHPNLSDVRLTDPSAVMRRAVWPEIDHFVAPVYERLCAQWIQRRAAAGELGFHPTRCGRWWDGNNEIDILAFDKKTVLVAECKWSSRPVGQSALDKLVERAERLSGFDGHARRFAMFSRSGFRGLAPAKHLLLVDLATLVEDRMPTS